MCGVDGEGGRYEDAKWPFQFYRPYSLFSTKIGVYDPLEVGSPSEVSSESSTGATSGLESLETFPTAQVSPLAPSNMRIIGQAHQEWGVLRRKYDLVIYRQSSPSSSPGVSSSGNKEGRFAQFAKVDEAFISRDFSLLSANTRLLGSVNRNFSGLGLGLGHGPGRGIFTDITTAGLVYALRLDAASLAPEATSSTFGITENNRNEVTYATSSGLGLTLDQRAVMLATAVSIDSDFFSR